MAPTAIAIKDETGERCATVGFKREHGAYKLDDLWFFTGSICNLKCIHCYTGSSPQNSTYEFLSLADIGPVLEEAGRSRFATSISLEASRSRILRTWICCRRRSRWRRSLR